LGVTIRDIASLANTSTATVSRVLSGKPGVQEATRQRIVALADKLGYRPNRIAQNLAMQKSHVLGFIAADLESVYYIEFFRHVQRAVEPLGYQVLVADSERRIEKEKQNIEVMRMHQAEGLIVFPVHDWELQTDIDHFLQLRLQKFPFVIVGKLDGGGFDLVTSSEVDTASRVANHLLSLGHRRIGFVGYDMHNRPVRERFEGARDALRQAGLDFAPDHVIKHVPDWLDALVAMLRKPDRPTALIMMNDICALIACRPIQDLGLRIPEDISIAGFDNGIWTRHMRPSLTTTAVNTEEVARIALDMLMCRIGEPDRPAVQNLVPQEFLARESTGPCP
jgi:DNA-binding LacI/PurR family transcriptional regulator